MYYSPFEFIRRNAKVVLVGITPGASQAATALRVLRQELLRGATDFDALQRAKSTASFAGPLRANLVAMLDSIGLNRKLSVASCSEVFTDGSELVHFTSALRFPTFYKGANYSGNPSIVSSRLLQSISDRLLGEEATALPRSMWIPLGKESAAAVERLVSAGTIDASQVLDGLPHPSGANSERIAYFIGKKARSQLSEKTNPEFLEAVRAQLTQKLGLPSEIYAPAQPAWTEIAAASTRTEATPQNKRLPRTGTRNSDRAERALASALRRLKTPTVKVAGFETDMGRHLAIQRDSATIKVWTEDLDFPADLGIFRRYSASTARHSNLGANAPRCANGHCARLWEIDGLDNLDKLIAWYAKA